MKPGDLIRFHSSWDDDEVIGLILHIFHEEPQENEWQYEVFCGGSKYKIQYCDDLSIVERLGRAQK